MRDANLISATDTDKISRKNKYNFSQKYKVVLEYDEIKDANKVANKFRIDNSSVYDWVKQRKDILGMILA